MQAGVQVFRQVLRSVVAAQRTLAIAVGARRGVGRAVAHAAAGRISVTKARTYRIFVAGARAPGGGGGTGGTAVGRAFGVTAALVAVVVGAIAIATLPIGRIGRVIAGTAIGRALVDVVIL